MSGRLTREAYQKLIDENRDWLAQQPRTLEREHIDAILKCAVEYEYDYTRPKERRELVVLAAEMTRETCARYVDRCVCEDNADTRVGNTRFGNEVRKLNLEDVVKGIK